MALPAKLVEPLTDEALIDLPRGAGVSYTAADVIAPSIRVAVRAYGAPG